MPWKRWPQQNIFENWIISEQNKLKMVPKRLVKQSIKIANMDWMQRLGQRVGYAGIFLQDFIELKCDLKYRKVIC